jgi:signal transduction histidine kinase/CheY-like chemotaxis protein/HPt (histidine-containing phosphotransfer) domain-containing protein
MIRTKLDIHRKLAILLAGALLLAVFLAFSIIHFLAGAWRLERASRQLLNVRRIILQQASYVEDLVIARQRGENTLEQEASSLLRVLMENGSTQLEELESGGGLDKLPRPPTEPARTGLRLLAERWEFQQEAVVSILEGRRVMSNREVVRQRSRELVNQLHSVEDIYRTEARRKTDGTRVCLLLFVLGFVLDVGYGVWLLGFGFFRRFRRVTERLKELGSVDLQADTMPATEDTSFGDFAYYLNRFVERARAADRTKDRFLAAMSHEIRTPMNGVIGFLENLRETPLNEQQQQYVRLIDSSARSLLKVINGILDFSKIAAGRMELEAVAFDLRQLLEDRQAMTRQLVRGKRVKVSLDLPEDTPLVVRGDPTRLRQVLDNLLGNAAKFTDKGEIAIGLSAKMVGAESVSLAFSVEDTGIGIPPDRLKNLFEAFKQADAGTARKYGGTGLGLCISAGLVSLMGGELTARSNEGEGSCFEFTIGLATARPEEQVRLSDHFTIMIPAGALRQFWALLVDDTPTNLFLMETVCQSIGLPYRTARNGQEAVDLCRQHHFDLVFMDIQMPVMDGYTAIREIRKLEDAQTTQIIALTASAFQEDVDRALGAGSTGFIAKPFERNHLLLTIAEHLGVAVERKLREMPEAQEDETDVVVRRMYDFMQRRYQASLGEIKLVLAQTVSDWRPLLDDLRVFSKQGTWESVRAIMHRLKGQLGAIGLEEFSEVAEAVNASLRKGETDGVVERIDQFVEELSDVFRRLEAEVTVDRRHSV